MIEALYPLNTIYEQMGMTIPEIESRFGLLDLSKNERELLFSQKNIINDHIDKIIDDFYDLQLSNPDVALIIGDLDTLTRLKSVQKDYVLELFGGNYDQDYINYRFRVGVVHKRIGVKPKHYIAAVASLKAIILQVLHEHVENGNHKSVFVALDKLFYFDITLVMDAYIHSMISEIENAQAKAESFAHKIEALSNIDPLTKVFNRRALDEQFKRHMVYTKRSKQTLSVLVIDLDKFKHINDQHGHKKGDEVLQTLGGILLKNSREHVDLPCRYGGDEFLMVMSNCKASDAKIVGDRILREFQEIFPEFSFSIGIADTGPEEFLEPGELIEQADAAMYEAKRGIKPREIKN